MSCGKSMNFFFYLHEMSNFIFNFKFLMRFSFKKKKKGKLYEYEQNRKGFRICLIRYKKVIQKKTSQRHQAYRTDVIFMILLAYFDEILDQF